MTTLSPTARRQMVTMTIRALWSGKDREWAAERIRNARVRGWYWFNMGRDLSEQVLNALDSGRQKKEALAHFVCQMVADPDFVAAVWLGREEAEVRGYAAAIYSSQTPAGRQLRASECDAVHEFCGA